MRSSFQIGMTLEPHSRQGGSTCARLCALFIISPKKLLRPQKHNSIDCTNSLEAVADRKSARHRVLAYSSSRGGNTGAVPSVEYLSEQSEEERITPVATDYDEVRSDVKESQERSLEALQSANAPDARSVVRELDEADSLDGAMVPGGEIVAEELTVQVIPQANDEFTCYSCFLVRHRSQIAREKNGHAYCVDCEG